MSKTTALMLTLLFLFSAGCARKDWNTPLLEDEVDSFRQLLTNQQVKMQQCSQSIDAEMAATWDSQLYDGGINGYLQVLLPERIKVVAVNPLGQPLFAIVTDGVTFQTINAVKGVYKHGKMASFADRHSLPKEILQGNLAMWLSGRMTFDDNELTELHHDISARGIWLTIEKGGKRKTKEYILYVPASDKIIERVPISSEGNEIARIQYDDWVQNGECAVPQTVIIHGISFGTDITVKLSEVLVDKEFTPETFALKLPPGYLRQYYP